MAIKKPAGLSKPTGLKKPNVKKPITKPTEIKQEETAIEIPVVVDNVEEIAPELLESIIEAENQQLEEQEYTDLNEIIEDNQISQMIEERDVQDNGNRHSLEEVKEEVKTKSKKSSKRSSKKKEDAKEELAEQEELPQVSLQETVERMSADINITLPEWEEQKLEIQDKLKALTIDPDANPTMMKNLIGELDELLCELRFLLSDVEDQVEALNSHIEYIRVTNSKGTNSEERKAAGYFALVNHKKDPSDTEVINLVQYQNFMNAKLRFVNNAVKTVESRQKLLITFSSMIKVEANL